MYDTGVMALILGFDDAGAALADLGDEGTPAEQAFVAELRADGLVHEAPVDDQRTVDLMPLLEARDGGASATDLALLEEVDAASLDEIHEQVAYLKRCDRVVARAQALRAEALVALAGAEPTGAYATEVHVEHEVAVASRTSRHAAGKAIETSRSLATTFPSFAEALSDGDISLGHCTALVDRTRVVVDADALANIERVGLVRARRMTVGEFAHELAALIARFDPDAVSRAVRAREQRRVSVRRIEDGLGFLGMVDDWTTIKAVHERITTDAKVMQAQRRARQAAEQAADDAATTGAMPDDAAELAAQAGRAAAVDVASMDDDDARLDACRADALAARVLGAPAGRDPHDVESDDPGTVIWERDAATSVEVRLVIDLDTLRREADDPCLLDGTPIPAELGRELASYAKAWRRMVTDPVDGHLLDYGTRVYLPGPLRDYVRARDGRCCAPGCTTSAESRLQMDHAVPFPLGGSNPTNAHMLCTTCHQLKTAGLVHVVDPGGDGSATWVTAWGQTVWIPPRSYLPDVEPPPPPPEPIPF
jgi:hypothetical protein